MANVPPGVDTFELTRAARTVLLDAFGALAPHLDAVVLVGAQAVYLHAGNADLGLAAYTSDGDLGLDPARLADAPQIEQIMAAAGFSREHVSKQAQPGIWWKPANVGKILMSIEVDLLVPQELAGGSHKRRGVALGDHDRNALRRVAGLAVAMEDNALHQIRGLQDGDNRSVGVRVAGVPALLVAKSFKLAERQDSPDRLNDKDASDVFVLMLTADIDATAATFEELLRNERAGQTAAAGLGHLHRLFGEQQALGVAMAQRALSALPAGDLVAGVAPAFMAQMPRPGT